MSDERNDSGDGVEFYDASQNERKRELLNQAKRIVIKMGSSLILREMENKKQVIDEERLRTFIEDIAALKDTGKQVVLVSSGAVGLGKSILDLESCEDISLNEKQAAAAVGNPMLMAFYNEAFGKLEKNVGQVLMTPANTDEPRRRLNIRQAILSMLEKGVVPIINENDTVTTYSIRYGDNDSLASLVAKTISADLVILLTDIPGYYENYGKDDEKLLELSKRVLPKHFEGAGGAGSNVGTGGMYTKIKAAKIATEDAGCHLVVASGRDAQGKNPQTNKIERDRETDFTNIRKLFDGQLKHTTFETQSTPTEARNLQIMSEGSCSHGAIIVKNWPTGDIIPANVIGIVDKADRGDVVKILLASEHKTLKLIGWGILSHSLEDVDKIKGLDSPEAVKKELGYSGRYNVISRDDMVLKTNHDNDFVVEEDY